MSFEFVANNWYLFVVLATIVALIVVDPIRRRMSGVQSVSAIELPRILSHESAIIVDVCDAKDFKTGHIPDAINVPLKDLRGQLDKLEKYKDRALVVTCRAGSRAMNAAHILQRNGFAKLYALSGGFLAWQKENLPVEK